MADIEGQELFTSEALTTIRTLMERLRDLEGVSSVFSIFDVRRRSSRVVRLLVSSAEDDAEQYLDARDRALRHPAVAGNRLAEDAGTMLVLLRLAGDSLSVGQLQPRITNIRRMITRVRLLFRMIE